MTSEDFGDAYLDLVGEDGDGRWAYGTGFADPLAGVDRAAPAGVDGGALAAYCLMLGDDALIYSQRLQEWVTRAPELEEETALANIALDLLGQARRLLTRAGQVDGSGRDEDRLAFFRDEPDFRNVQLVEPADRDFAELVVRLLIFSTWRHELFSRLRGGADPVLVAIALSAVREIAYHRDYAARWTVRLGAGTALSRRRAQAALQRWWPFVPELFAAHPVETALPDIAADPRPVASVCNDVLGAVLAEAGLDRPDVRSRALVDRRAGRDGVHTEDMGHVLAEMQSVARAHPGATW